VFDFVGSQRYGSGDRAKRLLLLLLLLAISFKHLHPGDCMFAVIRPYNER
jgi:hypothetical protein